MKAPFPSEVIVQRLNVPFTYPVAFTRNLFHPQNPLLRSTVERHGRDRVHRLFVCLDAGLAAANPRLAQRIGRYVRHHAQRMTLAAEPFVVPGGEGAKRNLRLVARLIERLGALRLCRQSFVVAVGGGSVLDVVGFAASLVHRGLRLIRVPSTVEAQNDVGVGVKTGLDAHGVKNLLGTFAPPCAVLNDLDLLDTLPCRDWIAGTAEAFKVALIKDARFFDFLCRQAGKLAARDRTAMEALVRRCALLHLRHIREGGDPFEMGSARPLDFGHWSAHQLEVMSNYALRHGEAVAIGIALDTYYAVRLGFLPLRVLTRLLRALRRVGLPIWHPLLEKRRRDGTPAILEGLERFREHLGGALTITLPATVGRNTTVHEMEVKLLAEGIAHLKAGNR